MGLFNDNEADVDLDYDTVGKLNFGGGFVRKEGTNVNDSLERPKSKKEVRLLILQVQGSPK